MQFSDIPKLLETSWGQAFLFGCLIYIMVTFRSQTKVLTVVVEKITEIDKHISNKKAVDEALEKSEHKKDEKIKDLETRLRVLEIGKN